MCRFISRSEFGFCLNRGIRYYSRIIDSRWTNSQSRSMRFFAPILLLFVDHAAAGFFGALTECSFTLDAKQNLLVSPTDLGLWNTTSEWSYNSFLQCISPSSAPGSISRSASLEYEDGAKLHTLVSLSTIAGSSWYFSREYLDGNGNTFSSDAYNSSVYNRQLSGQESFDVVVPTGTAGLIITISVSAGYVCFDHFAMWTTPQSQTSNLTPIAGWLLLIVGGLVAFNATIIPGFLLYRYPTLRLTLVRNLFNAPAATNTWVILAIFVCCIQWIYCLVEFLLSSGVSQTVSSGICGLLLLATFIGSMFANAVLFLSYRVITSDNSLLGVICGVWATFFLFVARALFLIYRVSEGPSYNLIKIMQAAPEIICLLCLLVFFVNQGYILTNGRAISNEQSYSTPTHRAYIKQLLTSQSSIQTRSLTQIQAQSFMKELIRDSYNSKHSYKSLSTANSVTPLPQPILSPMPMPFSFICEPIAGSIQRVLHGIWLLFHLPIRLLIAVQATIVLSYDLTLDIVDITRQSTTYVSCCIAAMAYPDWSSDQGLQVAHAWHNTHIILLVVVLPLAFGLICRHQVGMVRKYRFCLSMLRRGDYSFVRGGKRAAHPGSTAIFTGYAVGYGSAGLLWIATVLYLIPAGLLGLFIAAPFRDSITQKLGQQVIDIVLVSMAILFSLWLLQWLLFRCSRRIVSPLEYSCMYLNVCFGLISFCWRQFLSLLSAAIYSGRLDMYIMGSKFRRFDSGYSVFCNLVIADHQQSNPILLEFVQILLEHKTPSVLPSSVKVFEKSPLDLPSAPSDTVTSKLSRLLSEVKGGGGGRSARFGELKRPLLDTRQTGTTIATSASSYEPPSQQQLLSKIQIAKIRARNRWFLALTLLRNPNLISTRIHGPQAGVALFMDSSDRRFHFEHTW